MRARASRRSSRPPGSRCGSTIRTRSTRRCCGSCRRRPRTGSTCASSARWERRAPACAWSGCPSSRCTSEPSCATISSCSSAARACARSSSIGAASWGSSCATAQRSSASDACSRRTGSRPAPSPTSGKRRPEPRYPRPAMAELHIKDHSIARLRERLAEAGERPYRADQIAAWLYRRGVEDPERMTDLGAELRARLAREWQLSALDVERVDRSVDGTCKAALLARDGARIESVLIPEDDRTTLCVSTQVGCAMACEFCATGFMGFTRNLRAAEIVDQVCRMRALAPPDRPISNVVFMGMGEPLLNLDAVVEAIRLLIDPKAFAIAPRRVTVSTVGLVPKIGELLSRVPVNLAVSLHATN